ncbi:hypothetical protein R1flu_011618 [Riccia fluitans]|uniref:PIN-like protein n=1 Tax=Riccia fluitans TaxID=41844 RepID=A0ABD1Z8B2_9MARC
MGTDLLSAFSMAVLPVAKLLLTCAFGAWLASKYMQVLTAEGRKHMNMVICSSTCFSLIIAAMMVFLAYTPALVFSKLTNAVTIENIVTWWYMPLNVILSYSMGSGLAIIVISYTSPPPHLKSLVIASCAAGNIGNIMLVLVPSICHDKENPFGASEACSQNGVAYVSFGMLTGMVLTWSFIYSILKPAEKDEIGIEKNAAVVSSATKQVECFVPYFCGVSETTIGVRTNVTIRTKSANPDEKSVWLRQTYCSKLTGLIVGLVPSFKWLFLGPLRAFTDSAEIIGQAMIPCMNLVLGASLVQGSQTCEMPLTTIIGIILVRFLALPVLGMMTIKIAHDFGFLPEDPLFRFVLMLQFTMPTAINVGT